MKLELAEKLVEFIVDCGEYTEDDVYIIENYSGRAMYGGTTTGLVIPSVTVLIQYIIMFAPELSEIHDEDDIYSFETINELYIDSLGRSYLIY